MNVISEQDTVREVGDEEELDLLFRAGPGWWLPLLYAIGVALFRRRPIGGEDARPVSLLN